MVFLGFNTYPVLNVGRGFGFLPPQHWHGFECAILSLPKDAKAHFYDTEHHPFEGGVLCFRAIGQFAGDDLQGHPFPHFCITGGITSEKT